MLTKLTTCNNAIPAYVEDWILIYHWIKIWNSNIAMSRSIDIKNILRTARTNCAALGVCVCGVLGWLAILHLLYTTTTGFSLSSCFFGCCCCFVFYPACSVKYIWDLIFLYFSGSPGGGSGMILPLVC